MAVIAMTRCICGCGASTDAPGASGWWLVETVFGFQVVAWEDKLEGCLQPAAGFGCVHKLLSQWMESEMAIADGLRKIEEAN